MPRKRAVPADRVNADLGVFEMRVAGERLVVMTLPTHTTVVPDRTLSAAEREVAIDAAGGMSNAAIAAKRGRSARTIANQLASIYRKLGVASRGELAARLLPKSRSR